jgi:alpha-amylase
LDSWQIKNKRFHSIHPARDFVGIKLTDIVFVFEVHQPFRLKKTFFWEQNVFRRLRKEELFDFYFDTIKDKEIFERACRKCYFPSNEILLELIDEFKKEKKRFKVSFSISGIFFEQCEMFNQDMLESFKQLAETGCVEFLDQTYHHSLAGLYPIRDEFIEEVEMHRELMKSLLNFKPTTFENTELLYNNAIAKTVEKLGYVGIFTEGAERILKGRSPNYLYKAKNCEKLKVFLRNYKLTDDIGFRFSARWWSGWPLTADKYASWLAATPGQVISIFPDYETFGEHHWPETGIHDFLRHLPREILKWEHLNTATPSEVLNKHRVLGEIDVPELGETVSWADIERDASCWLGNTMQWAYYTKTKDIEPLVKESQDKDFLKLWRYFLVSDHLYYMFTAGGSPGEVHTYFSPYGSPTDAFVTALGATLDLESRLRLYVMAANEPFSFYTGSGEEKFTGVKAWSLKGFIEAVKKVGVKSIEFHNEKGDFEKWANFSLRDEKLAKQFKRIKGSEISSELLIEKVQGAAEVRLRELREKTSTLMQF